MAENVGAAEVLPQISQIITDVRVRRPPTESTDFRSKSAFKGVHLSPLGFAACQSKKCTNRTDGTNRARSVPSAWLVQQRLLHPLRNAHQQTKSCATRHLVLECYRVLVTLLHVRGNDITSML